MNQFFRHIGLIAFLQRFGYSLNYVPLINTDGAVVLGMVYNFLPFMVLPIYNVLIKIDRDVINAARYLDMSVRKDVGLEGKYLLVMRENGIKGLAAFLPIKAPFTIFT